MRQNEPSRNEDTPRDPLLETAFTHFIQQAKAPTGFAARVRARVLGSEGQSRAWHRRVVTWLRGIDGQEELRWTHTRLGHVRTVVLVTCLVLSVLGNVWLGVRLFGHARSEEARLASLLPAETPQAPRGLVRLRFADDMPQKALRDFLRKWQVTIIAAPSPEGFYRMLVPLPTKLRLRGEPSGQEAPMDSLLKALQKEPYVQEVVAAPPP